MRYLYALALIATPALAQVPTSTVKTASADCLAQAVADFRSAWQQDTGNPYYGTDESIVGIYAVQAAARACDFRKASGPAPDAAALDKARREGAERVKDAVAKALAGV